MKAQKNEKKTERWKERKIDSSRPVLLESMTPKPITEGNQCWVWDQKVNQIDDSTINKNLLIL